MRRWALRALWSDDDLLAGEDIRAKLRAGSSHVEGIINSGHLLRDA